MKQNYQMVTGPYTTRMSRWTSDIKVFVDQWKTRVIYLSYLDVFPKSYCFHARMA